MKRALIVAAGVAMVLTTMTPAFSAEGMKIGLGYFRPEAPVGGRIWFTENVAGDLGIGFSSQKLRAGSPVKEENKISFTVDLGVPFVLVSDESTKFFVRPGFTYATAPGAFDAGKNDWLTQKDMTVAGSLGVEHFFSKQFSLQAAHGIMYHSHDSGVSGADKVNTFGTEAFGISSIGFHFYFVES